KSSRPCAVVLRPAARARASPSEAGSIPTIHTGDSCGLRIALYMRSVPMLPEPSSATLILLTEYFLRRPAFRTQLVNSLVRSPIALNLNLIERTGPGAERQRAVERFLAHPVEAERRVRRHAFAPEMVAGRQVIDDGEAGHVLQRLVDAHIAAFASDHHRNLGLP